MTAIAVGRNKDFDVQIGNLHTHYSVYIFMVIFLMNFLDEISKIYINIENNF